MKNYDEFNAFAEILGNLIAKYADVLDLDSMPEQNLNSEDTRKYDKEKNEKNENTKSIAS